MEMPFFPNPINCMTLGLLFRGKISEKWHAILHL